MFEFSLTSEFAEAAFGALLGGAATWAYRNWQARRAAQQLQTGHVSTATVTIDSTFYWQSGETNIRTRRPFIDQEIRTWRQEMPFSELIPNEFEAEISKCLQEARQSCTQGNPLVLMHLKNIIDDPARFDAIMTILKKGLIDKVSELFQDPRHYFQDSHSRPPELKIFPVLVAEANTHENKYRLILLHDDQLNPDSFPDIHHTRFRESVGMKDRNVHNIRHTHAKRLHLHKTIATLLSAPENEWMITDRLVRIPAPTPTLNLATMCYNAA
ncbi:MAG: hypothetical protein V4621_05770 [Pseudomonadota bacterium]